MISNRIGIKSLSGSQWKTSPDGTYKWDTNCKYEGYWMDKKQNEISTIDACADHCKANPGCNFFDLRVGKQGCLLSKFNGFFAETKAVDPGCGFLVSRRYNVEYFPKCNYNNIFNTSVITAAPTDTFESLNYVNPIETADDDDNWLTYY